MKLTNSSGNSIVIDPKPLASGGEGTIHVVQSSSTPDIVAKLFRDQSKAKQEEKKVRHLCQCSPSTIRQAGRFEILWPSEILLDSGNFAGFLLVKAPSDAIKLTYLSLPMSPTVKFGPAWEEYAHSHPESQKKRLNLCLNLAFALEALEDEGYTMLDLKPDNLLVGPNGSVHLIDMDSVQVADQSGLLFPASVVTPEYAPAEHHNSFVDFGTELIRPTWGAFSFAVLCYELLLGIHPFAGAFYKNRPANLAGIPEYIAEGLYPNGKHAADLDGNPAPPHRNIAQIPPVIQGLWLRAFEEGTVNPHARPTIYEWVKVLQRILRQNNSSPSLHRPKFSSYPRAASELRANSSFRANTQLIIR
jgi:DNA-binding helix-hairpin-helix protein with protein kinase domain